MEKQIVSIPEARLLLASLRSVGYTAETAIADIVDNCISAHAENISIIFNWEEKKIIIVDDGEGMSQKSLIENMRIGSSDPAIQRSVDDLGRFGMGMKTAAFSLGKRLTVITRLNDEISNASWDLDQIPEIGWNLIIRDAEYLKEYGVLLDAHGTVVVIEELDRLIGQGDGAKAKKKFFSTIDKVSKHLGLTFHRFISEDGLSISINENPVEAWDPFITANSATQELPEEQVWSDSGFSEVEIQPYVLPHKTKFVSDEEFQAAGGPKGWNYHQGIYVYRNRRLIICGTWFDYIKKEPAFNLARIRVDITSASDEEWQIDIKKSTAALPVYVREYIERAIEICTDASAKVYNSRGVYSKAVAGSPNLDYVWEQRKKNGRYSFHINRKHALLADVKKHLDEKGQNLLNAYISLVENFAPFMQSGITETLSKGSDRNIGSLEYRMEIDELSKLAQLFLDQGFAKEEIKTTLLDMANYRHLRKEILGIVEEIE